MAPPSRAVLLVIMLGGLTAFGPLSIDMYLPALPSMARDFASPTSQVQLTLAACLAGLALGQLLAGPVSDTLGRRVTLLVGLAAYAVASLMCIFAPSMYALVVLRLVQGLAGAVGIVIARAIVRDLHSGVAAARLFSTLMIVSGLAPILAPLVGGQLLLVTSWRGVFFTLAIISLVLLFVVTLNLPETLPSHRRRDGGLRETFITFWQLATDRIFIGYALACGLGFGAMFAYISGSPFVLQNIYGISPQLVTARSCPTLVLLG